VATQQRARPVDGAVPLRPPSENPCQTDAERGLARLGSLEPNIGFPGVSRAGARVRSGYFAAVVLAAVVLPAPGSA
jgi:hypothetical protein